MKLDLLNGTPVVELSAVKNKVVITASGSLRFNGRPVSRSELQALLEAAAQAQSEPELQIQPDAHAPYAVVDEVLVMTRRARLTRLGFVGNEAYARF